MEPNATLVERIWYYAEHNKDREARALCSLADYLEECFAWEVGFANPNDDTDDVELT